MTKTTKDLNRELILDELSNFEVKKTGDIPDVLNEYLESIAQNGDTMFSWTKLQPLLKRKLEVVMNEFNEMCPTDHLIPLPNVKPFDFEELKSQILEAIECFCSAPFTIQRICELITNPSKHYKRTDKFMRGIEKNILVVTTVEPLSANGTAIPYTSSFKNLFSSLHSSSNSYQTSSSMSSASTSLLVNGIADVLCDNQMLNEPTMKLSGPVSPTSLPLSPTTGSPPNPHQHNNPLQQLDSFTTVFASSPSNPLSVVYEHSSSLSIMPSISSEDNCLLSTASTSVKPSETSTAFDTNINTELDSSHLISSTSGSQQTNVLPDINSDMKSHFTENESNHELNETKRLKSNETISSSEISEQLSDTSYDDNKEIINKIDNNVNVDKPNDNVVLNVSTSTAATISSVDIDSTITSNIESTDTIKPDNTSPIVDAVTTDVPLNESNVSLVPELISQSSDNKTIECKDNNNEMSASVEEDMSQPMDFCGSTVTTDNNITNITDLSDKNSDLSTDMNRMDEETASNSDQSEPMDED